MVICLLFLCFFYRRVGVVAIDVALSDVEDLIKSIPLTDGELFMMNLADGTAVIHPLAKRSYEVKRPLTFHST